MFQPLTSPKPKDIALMNEVKFGQVRVNAYDMLVNGVEVDGSIRIFNKNLQAKIFDLLGFTKEEAQAQFGFIMNAFLTWCASKRWNCIWFRPIMLTFGGENSIRDFITFP